MNKIQGDSLLFLAVLPDLWFYEFWSAKGRMVPFIV